MGKVISKRWKIYWLIFAVTLIVYLTMVLWSLPKISEMADGAAPFDLQLTGYSFETAKTFISEIGSEGRDFYLNTQQLLDTVYPALLGLTLLGALIGLDRGGWGWVLSIFAIAGCVFDYLENAAVRVMLQSGPQSLTQAMVENASGWTVLKSFCHSIAMTGLLILALLFLYKTLTTRKADAGATSSEDDTVTKGSAE